MKTLVNQLGKSLSPYLRAHSQNPVAWQTWNAQSLDLAKTLGRPIFLSIGYTSCHWCHYMNSSYFSQDAVAEILNNKFFPIKVDKDERPDIDSIYQIWAATKLGQKGWPLNVFLEPEKQQAFYGGTLWDEKKTGIGFEEMLVTVGREWKKSQAACVSAAVETAGFVKVMVDSKSNGEAVALDAVNLGKKAGEAMIANFDTVNHGFMSPPLFPLSRQLTMLRAYPEVYGNEAKEAASASLDSILRGGIYDQLGDGIHRYSRSGDWHLPNFEKHLVDQAMTLQAALPSPVLPLAKKLADYLLDGPLASEQGLWYSAIDGDSDGKEGKYYTWTYEEFSAALADLQLLEKDMVEMYFGVKPAGNVNSELDEMGDFKLKNVISVYNSSETVAQTFGQKVSTVKDLITTAKSLLLKSRALRPPPKIDTKIITGWNGLAIGALSKASVVLGNEQYLTKSCNAAELLVNHFGGSGTIYRTFGGDGPAMCEDYAFLISGILNLYEVTKNSRWLEWAEALQGRQNDLFSDPRGGYFQSQDAHLWMRPKSAFDEAEPNYNSVSLDNLNRLGHKENAQRLLRCYSQDIEAQPSAYLAMLHQLPLH